MKKTDCARTVKKGELVTSIYAETFLNDDHCDYNRPLTEQSESELKANSEEDEWVSPSDLLIGILDLNPPFTSKITRGQTHKGILNIGNDVLEREHAKFLKYMTNVINENDAAWNYILEHEKAEVAKKVEAIYNDILTKKSKILMKEINIFYEKSLQELEDHLRSEVQTVLLSAHANIISDLNFEIKEKLKKEKDILEGVLQKRYDSEVHKIQHYYKLLLDNEIYRNDKLINKAIYERNDALKAFYKQIEAQNITSTMYVMSTERKKCRIRKFILENIQSTEIAEKLQKIKERQDIIDAYKAREKRLSDINKEWEEKIKKILQLFLKFISFSLKLLPEQTTFLLDLEKLFVLQLNEMQKSPSKMTSILVDTDDNDDIFKFEEPEEKATVSDKKPFVIEGDPTDPAPPQYGSRETLASNVDLPYIRVQRKFIYAKCGRMDEVRDFLKSQQCKCRDKQPPLESSSSSTSSESTPEAEIPVEVKSESSYEPMLMDDIEILQDCPMRLCKDWASKYSFPWLFDYLDFSEENYERVKAILGKLPERDAVPDLIDLNFMTSQELPFAATKEPYHTVGTQYSSQEDISKEFTCACMENIPHSLKKTISQPKIKMSESREIKDLLIKRQASVRRLINKHPNLLQLFTDESFDFVYTIK